MHSAKQRGWTNGPAGETFGCVGCHEDKNSTTSDRIYTAAALKKAPQRLRPPREREHGPVQEMARFQTESQKRAMAYLGSNAPQGMDVPKGFSYTREIQPIWDAHCINATPARKGPDRRTFHSACWGITARSVTRRSTAAPNGASRDAPTAT